MQNETLPAVGSTPLFGHLRRVGIWGEAVAPDCCRGCKHLWNDSTWEVPNQSDYCGLSVFFPYRKGTCRKRSPNTTHQARAGSPSPECAGSAVVRCAVCGRDRSREDACICEPNDD